MRLFLIGSSSEIKTFARRVLANDVTGDALALLRRPKGRGEERVREGVGSKGVHSRGGLLASSPTSADGTARNSRIRRFPFCEDGATPLGLCSPESPSSREMSASSSKELRMMAGLTLRCRIWVSLGILVACGLSPSQNQPRVSFVSRSCSRLLPRPQTLAPKHSLSNEICHALGTHSGTSQRLTDPQRKRKEKSRYRFSFRNATLSGPGRVQFGVAGKTEKHASDATIIYICGFMHADPHSGCSAQLI